MSTLALIGKGGRRAILEKFIIQCQVALDKHSNSGVAGRTGSGELSGIPDPQSSLHIFCMAPRRSSWHRCCCAPVVDADEMSAVFDKRLYVFFLNWKPYPMSTNPRTRIKAVLAFAVAGDVLGSRS
jgi:hypothetical protein